MSCPIICEVSLKNVYDNAKKVKSLLNSKTKLYAVVKSDAYGHGLAPVSSCLYTIADGFCVSLASEALTLRISGCDKEILLLTPATKSVLESLIRKNVTLTVCNKAQLLDIVDASNKLGKVAKIHLKLNTGMNRLGADTVTEVNELVNLSEKSGVNLAGAYSHLGNVKDKKYSKAQLDRFLTLTESVKNYNEGAILHLASSGGILLGDKYHFDGVRSGIMLYGYSPIKADEIKLTPAMKVYAKTLGVRRNVNGNLLYGSKKYSKDVVTLLRMGYADGFFRGGNGKNPPLCMDLSVVDGEHNEEYFCVMDNAETLAKKNKTIPYEVLTSCSKRAKIVYI